LEKAFDKNSQQLKNQVASTAGDSNHSTMIEIKNFMGEVLMGVLSPKEKRNEESVRSSRESRDL
jgi:hypothetical protein